MPISLSDAHRKAFEKLQLKGLDERVLQQIEAAINEYVYAQTLEWEQLRPRQIDSLLCDFDAAITTSLNELHHIANGPHSEKLLRILEERFEKERAADSADFVSWLPIVTEQMRLFSSIVSGVRQSLSKSDAGRGDGKNWFPEFIYKLAEVFETLTGTEARVQREHIANTYHGPFFDFLCAAMQPLDDDFRYNGTTLGKVAAEALQRRRVAKRIGMSDAGNVFGERISDKDS